MGVCHYSSMARHGTTYSHWIYIPQQGRSFYSTFAINNETVPDTFPLFSLGELASALDTQPKGAID
jgi:hypothetical protein